MDKKELIITHPGGAHFDEVAAISLLMAFYDGTEFSIERRVPTKEEIEDPAIWVIDIGLSYDPAKRNFDHHQSLDCPASFVLIAKYLGLCELMEAMPWWNFKDEVDRFGPAKSSIKFNAGDELVNQNPVESWLTYSFAGSTETSLPIVKNFGVYLIREARLLNKQIDIWKSAQRLDIAGVPAIISETRDSTGLEEFRRLVANPPDIVISFDRRDEGWRLFRYENTPVDFTRIVDRPEIAFAHKTGFLAKTKDRLGIDELVSLVSGAVTKK